MNTPESSSNTTHLAQHIALAFAASQPAELNTWILENIESMHPGVVEFYALNNIAHEDPTQTVQKINLSVHQSLLEALNTFQKRNHLEAIYSIEEKRFETLAKNSEFYSCTGQGVKQQIAAHFALYHIDEIQQRFLPNLLINVDEFLQDEKLLEKELVQTIENTKKIDKDLGNISINNERRIFEFKVPQLKNVEEALIWKKEHPEYLQEYKKLQQNLQTAKTNLENANNTLKRVRESRIYDYSDSEEVAKQEREKNNARKQISTKENELSSAKKSVADIEEKYPLVSNLQSKYYKVAANSFDEAISLLKKQLPQEIILKKNLVKTSPIDKILVNANKFVEISKKHSEAGIYHIQIPPYNNSSKNNIFFPARNEDEIREFAYTKFFNEKKAEQHHESDLEIARHAYTKLSLCQIALDSQISIKNLEFQILNTKNNLTADDFSYAITLAKEADTLKRDNLTFDDLRTPLELLKKHSEKDYKEIRNFVESSKGHKKSGFYKVSLKNPEIDSDGYGKKYKSFDNTTFAARNEDEVLESLYQELFKDREKETNNKKTKFMIAMEANKLLDKYNLEFLKNVDEKEISAKIFENTKDNLDVQTLRDANAQIQKANELALKGMSFKDTRTTLNFIQRYDSEGYKVLDDLVKSTKDNPELGWYIQDDEILQSDKVFQKGGFPLPACNEKVAKEIFLQQVFEFPVDTSRKASIAQACFYGELTFQKPFDYESLVKLYIQNNGSISYLHYVRNTNDRTQYTKSDENLSQIIQNNIAKLQKIVDNHRQEDIQKVVKENVSKIAQILPEESLTVNLTETNLNGTTLREDDTDKIIEKVLGKKDGR